MGRKGGPWTLLEVQIGLAIMEKNMEIPPKILRMKLPYKPVLLLLGIYLKKAKTLIWKDLCTSMFIAALFTIAKIWKQFKCP